VWRCPSGDSTFSPATTSCGATPAGGRRTCESPASRRRRSSTSVDLVLESGAASGGKLRFDAFKAFGDVAEHVQLWEWPLARRPQLEKGHAVLHAKAALADDNTAFVTSANLTGLGLDENIELGLLVRRGPTPRRIGRYVRGLMAEGVLARA
jgi:phosphatidylserine/phosphatidylglycerophosphate/cardiolipin synthase-like enzyme